MVICNVYEVVTAASSRLNTSRDSSQAGEAGEGGRRGAGWGLKQRKLAEGPGMCLGSLAVRLQAE